MGKIDDDEGDSHCDDDLAEVEASHDDSDDDEGQVVDDEQVIKNNLNEKHTILVVVCFF